MEPDEIVANLDAVHNDLGHTDKFDEVMGRLTIEKAIDLIKDLTKENDTLKAANEALRQAMSMGGLYVSVSLEDHDKCSFRIED